MKKAFLFFILLFAFHGLFACSFQTDTTKGSVKKDGAKSDTIKHKLDSIKAVDGTTVNTNKKGVHPTLTDTLKPSATLISKETSKFDVNHFLDSIRNEVKLKRLDTLKYSAEMSSANLASSGTSKLIAQADSVAGLKTPPTIKDPDSPGIMFSILTDSVKNSSFMMLADSLSGAIRRTDSIRVAELAYLSFMKLRIPFMGIDSLKITIKSNKYDALKAPLYSNLAARYMQYDTLNNREMRLTYQTEAIKYTMLALHQYSQRNDTVGLRSCFDNLAQVYFAKKDYAQAKWFILQSNSMSRARNDNPKIISSLITLAAIKRDINDFNLALRDLNEALQLSQANHYQQQELDVLKNYGFLYNRMKNIPKADAVLKKREVLEQNIKKNEQAALIAKANRDSLQKIKTDTLIIKKKVVTASSKKAVKVPNAKKTTSL